MNHNPYRFRELLQNPVHLLAFGLGSGLLYPAPGTWGSAAGTLLFLPWASLLVDTWSGALGVLLSFLAGIYFCDKTAKDIGIHDFSGIVWDEFVGVWLVMVALPPSLWLKLGLWGCALAAFVLFRIFDIWKPWPIRWLDARVPGGFGIMIDDILAGGFALAVLWLAAWVVG